jgi:hypothetical protein
LSNCICTGLGYVGAVLCGVCGVWLFIYGGLECCFEGFEKLAQRTFVGLGKNEGHDVGGVPGAEDVGDAPGHAAAAVGFGGLGEEQLALLLPDLAALPARLRGLAPVSSVPNYGVPWVVGPLVEGVRRDGLELDGEGVALRVGLLDQRAVFVGDDATLKVTVGRGER